MMFKRLILWKFTSGFSEWTLRFPFGMDISTYYNYMNQENSKYIKNFIFSIVFKMMCEK
jgi:hypothetical protein